MICDMSRCLFELSLVSDPNTKQTIEEDECYLDIACNDFVEDLDTDGTNIPNFNDKYEPIDIEVLVVNRHSGKKQIYTVTKHIQVEYAVNKIEDVV
jgi:hypothetical protein